MIVVPKQPLHPGSTYHVSIAETYSGTPTITGWSFTADSVPQVSIGSASIVEGQAKTRSVRLTVSLSNPSPTPVTVHYTTAEAPPSAGFGLHGEVGNVDVRGRSDLGGSVHLGEG